MLTPIQIAYVTVFARVRLFLTRSASKMQRKCTGQCQPSGSTVSLLSRPIYDREFETAVSVCVARVVDVCVNSSQPTYMTVDTVITASQLANNNRQTKQSTQFQGLIITETFRPSNRRRPINL